jgi:hypothetical protein
MRANTLPALRVSDVIEPRISLGKFFGGHSHLPGSPVDDAAKVKAG